MTFRAFVIIAILAAASGAAYAKDSADIMLSTKSADALDLFNQAQEKLDNFLADQAGELFARAAAADPDFAMAYLGWANSSNNLKDFEDRLGMAMAHANKASEPERLIIESAKAQNDGNVKQAEECLVRAVELRPEGKRARYTLGNFYFGQQDYDSAEREYRKVIAIDPNFAPVYNILGYLLSNQNRYPEALEILQRYADLRPTDNNPRDSMGEICLYMGDYKGSIREYGKSLGIDSSFVPSWAGLGHIHVFMGDFSRGRAMYDQVKARAHTVADSNTTLFWTATSYCHEKKYDMAIRTLEEQLKFVRARNNPSLEAVIHGQIAEIYRETGQFEKAIEAARMERKVAMRPEISKGPRDNLLRDAIASEAVAFTRLGMPDSANARLEEYRMSAAEAANPIVTGNLNSLEGIVAFYKKDYPTAVTKLSQANKLDPISMYYIAMAHEESGQRTEAAKAYSDLAAMNRNSLSYGLTRPWAMAKAKG
jgi:tetratricopeptide (TPR) repeat protein